MLSFYEMQPKKASVQKKLHHHKDHDHALLQKGD